MYVTRIIDNINLEEVKSARPPQFLFLHFRSFYDHIFGESQISIGPTTSADCPNVSAINQAGNITHCLLYVSSFQANI